MKKNFIWNAVGNIVYLLCQWLITVLVPIIGGFRDAGILSVAMSVSATCQTIGMFGIRSFQVSDVEEKYSNSCYVGFRGLTCGGAMLACLIFSLASGYRSGQFRAILLFMIFRLAETYSDVLHGIAQKNGRLYIGGISFCIKGVGLLSCFLLAYFFTRSLNAGLLLMTLFSCGTVLLFDLPQVRKISAFRLTDAMGKYKALALETLPLCAYLFLFSAIYTLPKLILEGEMGQDVLGAYSSIYAPAMLLQAASGYLYTPFATHFAELRQQGASKAFLAMLLKIIGVMLALAAAVMLAAGLFGEFALVLVFGEEIRAYVNLLFPILLVNVVSAYLGFFCMVAIVLRKFRWLLTGCFAGFLLSVSTTKPAIRWLDTNGTSYSVIFSTVVACGILLMGILPAVKSMQPQNQDGKDEKSE